MRELRAAMIGAGNIASQHAAAIAATQGVTLVAACDIDFARAQNLARSCGGRAYRGWEELLEREPVDVIWVCTPPMQHRAPAIAALERGIHVYLEKPIARTLPDGLAIARAAARSDAVCSVGYQWHASELLAEARGALASRRVALLSGRNYGPVASRSWFLQSRSGGGQILERGSHQIDLQRAIAGEIAAVEAIPGSVKIRGDSALAGDIDDVLLLVFYFRNGALGTAAIAWSGPGQPGRFSLDIVAEDASLWLELGPERFALTGRAGAADVDVICGEPLMRSVASFLEAARSRSPARVPCGPDDAVRTLRVALACERALAGGRISVDE